MVAEFSLEDRRLLSSLGSLVTGALTSGVQFTSVTPPSSGEGAAAAGQPVLVQEDADLVYLANHVDAADLADLERVTAPLLKLYSRQMQQNAGVPGAMGPALLIDSEFASLFTNDGVRPHVTAWVRDVAQARTALAAIGMEITSIVDVGIKSVAGFLPIDAIAAASAATGVLVLDASERGTVNSVSDEPSPGGGATTDSLGNGDNEWDAVSFAQQLRRVLPGVDGNIPGVDGRVEIGVISDSINRVNGGIADSTGTNDLPAGRVTVITDGAAGDTDEGRAMAELIYDLVPEASFLYHRGTFSASDMATGMTELRQNFADIIVDDISYFTEPVFQDGVIAQTIDTEYLNNDVLFFSSAGNRNNESYGAPFTEGGGQYHDFGGGDQTIDFTLANNEQLRVFLHWSQPFGTGGATTDIDIEVWNAAISSKLADSNTNNVGGNPLDSLSFTNTSGSTQNYHLVFRRNSGPANVTLAMFAPQNDDDFTDSYVQNEPGINGNHAARFGFSIGAVNWATPNTIEPFSSFGPSIIRFTDAGAPLGFTETRLKPNFTAADGTETTVPGFSNFFGTSAAAPNAAAVAALIMDAANRRITYTELDNLFTQAAIGTNAGTGFWHPAHGRGRINALGTAMIAKGIFSSESIVELNHLGDGSFSSDLFANSDIDSVYFASDVSGTVVVDVVEGGTGDLGATLWNRETSAFLDIDYNTSGDDPRVSSAISFWTRYQAEIFNETDFASANAYTVLVNGPTQGFSNLALAAGPGNTRVASTNGLIDDIRDADYFGFVAPNGASGAASITLTTPDAAFDGVLSLFDVAGNLLRRQDGAGGGGTETINFGGLDPGQQYVVRIGSFAHGSQGNFTLNISTGVADLYFIARDAGQRELFKTDGTSLGTNLVSDQNGASSSDPGRPIPGANGIAYFPLTSGGQRELWRTDGSDAGTFMVDDLNGAASGSPQSLTWADGVLYFSANVGGQRELWKSDGTAAGTTQVKNLNGAQSANVSKLLWKNGTLYFVATHNGQRELWKSDGTAAGTTQVKNINGAASSNPNQLVAVGSRVYFTAVVNGDRELFRTNGTAAGTKLVKNLNGSGSPEIQSITAAAGSTLYFTAVNAGQRELWRSNGTVDGTVVVKNLNGANSANPGSLVWADGDLYFAATHGGQREVWRTDGTAAGTAQLKNINGAAGSAPQSLVWGGDGNLYFTALTGTERELWKSNGTAGGTAKLVNLNSTASSNPRFLTWHNGHLYFIALSGSQEELFVSNGFAGGGTHMVRNLNGGGSAKPRLLSGAPQPAPIPPPSLAVEQDAIAVVEAGQAIAPLPLLTASAGFAPPVANPTSWSEWLQQNLAKPRRIR